MTRLFAVIAAVLAFAPAAAGPARPQIAIIIDDLGHQKRAGERVIALPGPVTCAILPGTPSGAVLARAARASRKEVLLHLPMQASDPPRRAEPGMLSLAMDRSDVAAALDAALHAVATADSPFSVFHLRGLGGAMARTDPAATAFAHRQRRYMVSVLRAWFDPGEDAAPHRAWAESLWQAIRPEGNGAYANFLGDEGEARVREAYPGDTWERLAEIKRRYDPDNLFRVHHGVGSEA